MNIMELIMLREAHDNLKLQLFGMMEDLVKYYYGVQGSQPHTYDELADPMYAGMKELVSSTGICIFEMVHGVEHINIDYLNSKLSEIKEARLCIMEAYINKVPMDVYVFNSPNGIGMYTVKR